MKEQNIIKRVEYESPEFHQSDAGSSPMKLFREWLHEAQQRENISEPNAMALATASKEGVPSVRMVLLKNYVESEASFTWFTNLESRKAKELFNKEGVVSAALVFWWPADSKQHRYFERQVRVVGKVQLIDRNDVESYFYSRPHGAQVGAVASKQSMPISSRKELDAQYEKVAANELQLPDSWGGIKLIANEIEFWQGRPNRMHDRIVFYRYHDLLDVKHSVEVTDEHETKWLRARLQP